MQVSKKDYDELVENVDSLRESNSELRELNQNQANKLLNFDEILSKIARAANGLPINLSRDANSYGGQVSGYHGDNHQCRPPTNDEIMRFDMRLLQEANINLEARLAAVNAIAEFAKEHKA